MKQSLGVIGLGTMGANLARNAARNGATVAVYNRTAEKTDAFMKAHGTEGSFIPCKTYQELVVALSVPRAILLMVKAGPDTDRVIEDLAPLLAKGDTIIDAGNSHFADTERREKTLREKGIAFIGMGVSGGEEGALKGPSMMPGGDRSAVEALMPLFSTMAADDGSASLTTSGDGGKCVSYMGPGGAGHFVKMVHNGIEYGVMQLIAEAYDLLKTIGGLSNVQLADTFAAWNATPALASFLLEITADIFRKKDPDTGADLIDLIRDTAGQKGTGRWTTEAAFRYGTAIPSITAGVDARIISSSLELRKRSQTLPESLSSRSAVSQDSFVAMVQAALEFSMITTYKQGFMLIDAASKEEGWGIDASTCARIWRGGCIIRSKMLSQWQQLLTADWQQANEYFHARLQVTQLHCRDAVASGIEQGVPLPAMCASIAYYDAARRSHLPQNLIQAQRDYFGAHGFERTDREGTHHGDWH